MNKLLSIGQASKVLSVTIQTLRNWDKKGLLKPDELTKGGDRRYKLETLKAINHNIVFNRDDLKTIAYARVSSHDQKEDLVRQVQILELYCSKQGFNYEVIQDLAFQKFFRDLKQGKVSYPQFKKKRDNAGSYYIGGDQVVLSDTNKNSKKYKKIITECNAQYLKVPNLGYVKLSERLRFSGKINSVTISQNGDKYYASFSVSIAEENYQPQPKTKLGLGIDVGLKSFVSLSNGLEIKSPKPLAKLARKLKTKSRQLSKKQHPKTKGEKTKKSANYLKASLKLAKLHRRIANIRNNFSHKLSSSIIKQADYICLEDLNVKGMMKNHQLAKSIADVSFYEFRRQLEYKAKYNGKQIIFADRFYPSSKTCSQCGSIKKELKLSERIYCCEHCGAKINRDYNASINLLRLMEKQIGQVLPEFTPMDLTAIQSDLAINRIVTSKVEVGIQQRSNL